MSLRTIFLTGFLLALTSRAGAVPPLPEGLKPPIETERDAARTQSEPDLPEGLINLDLKEPPKADSATEVAATKPDWRPSAFIDTRLGTRLRDPIDQEQLSLAETRLQLKAVRRWSNITATVAVDILADAISDSNTPDLNTGEGFVDLREANVLWRPLSWIDIKAGRQILTWGTGEYLFLNDLFPKDYNSFFIGRPDAYLKAPSDAVKVSLFGDIANLDIVYSPQFDSDRFADGARLSVFNPFQTQVTGNRSIIESTRPADVFQDDELAARIYQTIGAYEGALYFYSGFWKSPLGFSSNESALRHNTLTSYGGSIRGPAKGGIANLEVAYYNSTEDPSGDEPSVPNSQVRFLLGYERELAKDFTGAVQVYLEQTIDYGALTQSIPVAALRPDKTRQVVTLRARKVWPENQVTATIFAAFSSTDQDGYIRANLNWSITDNLTLEAGSNILYGAQQTTQFAQLQSNSNIFVAARYGF